MAPSTHCWSYKLISKHISTKSRSKLSSAASEYITKCLVTGQTPQNQIMWLTKAYNSWNLHIVILWIKYANNWIYDIDWLSSVLRPLQHSIGYMVLTIYNAPIVSTKSQCRGAEVNMFIISMQQWRSVLAVVNSSYPTHVVLLTFVQLCHVLVFLSFISLHLVWLMNKWICLLCLCGCKSSFVCCLLSLIRDEDAMDRLCADTVQVTIIRLYTCDNSSLYVITYCHSVHVSAIGLKKWITYILSVWQRRCVMTIPMNFLNTVWMCLIRQTSHMLWCGPSQHALHEYENSSRGKWRTVDSWQNYCVVCNMALIFR